MPTVQSELVNADEVAKRFGVSVTTVNSWVRSRRIPFIRVSRRTVRFRLDELERCLRCSPEPEKAGRA